MVCGILAHKKAKRAAQAALSLCSTLSMLDNRPEGLELQAPHPSGGFSLAAFGTS
jgi:hypothetical protein